MKLSEKISNLIRSSIIFCALESFSSFLYRQLSESFWGRLFTAYGKEESTYKSGFFASFFKKDRRGKLLTRVKYATARAFEKNSFIGLLSKCVDYFLGCRLKVYGLFLLSFGIYTALMYVFKRYAFYLENSSIDHLWFGIGTVFISLFLIPLSYPLSDAVLGSRVMQYILSDALGVRFENITAKKSGSKGSSILFFVGGIIAGLLTYSVSPFYMIMFIFGLVVFGLIFAYPEVGILVMIFATPFIVFLPHPTLFLAGMVLVTALSYAIKLIRGKRTFRLDLIDFAVALFAALVFFGGVVSANPDTSFKSAAIFVCLMLGYFMIVNFMCTKLWLKRCISMLTSSAAIVSVYGLWRYFTGASNENWIDPEMFENISGRAVSTFENPNMLAEYIIMILPFAFALLLNTKKGHKKTVYMFSIACMILCLVYTWSRGAWLGILVGMTAFFLMYSKKTMYWMSAAVLALPFLPLVLPQTIIDRFMSIGNLADSSTTYRVYLWRSVWRIIEDFFVGGIGIGEGAFGYVYPMYTYAGMEKAPHSHSLYMQILMEIGIIGLIVFLVALFLFAQNSLEYVKKTSDNKSKLFVAAGLCGIIAILVQGSADYIWYNYRVFFIFWIIIGIVCAYRRLGYDEEERRAKLDENSAYIDIKISSRTQERKRG